MMAKLAMVARVCWGICLCLMISWGQTCQADLTVRGYDPLKHNRFSNNSQFIGNPFDWSGVARSSGGRWATMVSANYFISATHFHPGVGETLTIYGSNSVTGPTQVVNVVGGQQIAGSDIWLGRIDTPTNFGTFAVAGAVNPTVMQGGDLFVYGVASNVSQPTAQMKLGRNTVDQFLPNFSDVALGAAVTDVIIYDYDTPTGGVGSDEAKVNPGDSGAPSFYMFQNQPLLAGVHWFMYTSNDFGTPTAGSGDSVLARYINTINGAMVGQQLTIVTVPEPASLALVSVSVAGLWLRRRHLRRPAVEAA